jgi:hypothetical protein
VGEGFGHESVERVRIHADRARGDRRLPRHDL